MRISSFSFVIAVPFLLALALLLPLALTYEYQYLFPWLMIPVVVLVSLYIFRPQIDYWWVRNTEIRLEKPLVQWLEKNSLFYRSMDSDEKSQFEKRAALYLEAKDFVLKATEEHIPGEEFKLLAVHEAIRITQNLKDYLFDNYNRIILYPHAFPTPNYKRLHTLELHEDDGIVLLSQPHLVNGFLRPEQFFNTSLYAWISAYIRENPRLDYPSISKESLSELNNVYPYELDKINEVIGLGFTSPLTMHIHAYFQFPEAYRTKFPSIFQKLEILFGQKNEQ